MIVMLWFIKAGILTKWKGLEVFLWSIWSSQGKCGLCIVQTERDTILFECAATAHIFRTYTNNSRPPDECERLPPYQRLARVLLSKQRQCSWCGLSFPLSWPRYSTGVWGVWEKPVWRRREEVCIYLRWWGTIFHFDLSADPLLDRLASCRSHKVTMSTAKGPAWDSDSTCQDESASSGMPAGAGKISFLAVSVLVDFLIRCKWLTDHVKREKKYPYVMLSAVTTSLLTQRQICLFSTAIKGFKRT